MSLNNMFERAHTVSHTMPMFNNRQRMVAKAEALNIASDLQARLDICIAAMANLVKVLYTVDADGCYVYVDSNHRILVPLPWGSSGWRKWGLRKWEAEMLRKLLIRRCEKPGMVLFGYDRQQWYLDTEAFPTMNEALLWIQRRGPTLREWRAIVEPHRTRNAERMRVRRG